MLKQAVVLRKQRPLCVCARSVESLSNVVHPAYTPAWDAAMALQQYPSPLAVSRRCGFCCRRIVSVQPVPTMGRLQRAVFSHNMGSSEQPLTWERVARC